MAKKRRKAAVKKQRKATVKKRDNSDVTIASQDVTASFIEALQKKFTKKGKHDVEGMRRFLADKGNEHVQSIMRRALITMVRH